MIDMEMYEETGSGDNTTTTTTTTTTGETTTAEPAQCDIPAKDLKNSSWVIQNSKNNTLFIADTSFRVLTRYMNTAHRGPCPWAFSFDPKSTVATAKNVSMDGEWALHVTLDASDKR